MDKTKFFEKVKQVDCNEYPWHLITKGNTYATCNEYKKFAEEWNAKMDKKTVNVTEIDPCFVIVTCNNGR